MVRAHKPRVQKGAAERHLSHRVDVARSREPAHDGLHQRLRCVGDVGGLELHAREHLRRRGSDVQVEEGRCERATVRVEDCAHSA
eukprot:6188543-Pleurochrysis_carterae.AAC.5